MKKITLLFQVNNVTKFTLTNLWTGCLQLRVIIKSWIHFLQQQFYRSCNIHFVELTPVTSDVKVSQKTRPCFRIKIRHIDLPMVSFFRVLKNTTKTTTLFIKINNFTKFTLTNLLTGFLQLRVNIMAWIQILHLQHSRSYTPRYAH